MSKPKKLKIKLPSGEVKSLRIHGKPEWLELGFNPREAIRWMLASFSPDDAFSWKAYGLDHIEAKRLLQKDFDLLRVPYEIKEFMSNVETYMLLYREDNWLETYRNIVKGDEEAEEELSRIMSVRHSSEIPFRNEYDSAINTVHHDNKLYENANKYIYARMRVIGRKISSQYASTIRGES